MKLMPSETFRLYDTLNCCAIAIDESESGCPGPAETAWLEASVTSADLFPPDSTSSGAIGVIIDASAPGRTGEYRAWLWNALDAASIAVLPAMEGDRETTALVLPDAEAATALLPPDLRDAMTVILGEIRAMAGAGSGVAA